VDAGAVEMTGRAFDEEIEEKECDANLRIFLECIEGAYQASKEIKDNSAPPFAAIKVTALGRPVLLEKMTEIIRRTHALFEKFDGQARMQLSMNDFQRGLKILGVEISEEDRTSLFEEFDKNMNGKIDVHEWLEYLRVEDLRFRPFFRAKSQEDTEMLLPSLDQREEMMLENLMLRLNKIAMASAEKGVRLLIDAEHTHFQPAIDHVCINLMRDHNRGAEPIIFMTHQAYLRDSLVRVKRDIARARRENFILGSKLVRGAYMDFERARAKEHNYPDPIWNSIQETHLNYRKCLEHLFENTDQANVMIASHNQETMEFAVNQVDSGKVNKDRVFFGQLYGMADNLSLTLGAAGYNVYKYVPYGPLKEVIPYLTRRAQENSTLLGNTSKERQLLWQELSRRMRVRG